MVVYSCDDAQMYTGARCTHTPDLSCAKQLYPRAHAVAHLTTQHTQVYSGGIGSYALMVLVAAFLLTHSSRWRGKHSHRSSNAGEQCLGVLLVDMLRLYGREFNSQDVGITLRYGGQFLPRYEMECGRDDPPSRWVVEDPNNKENNLAGGSYGIFKVCVHCVEPICMHAPMVHDDVHEYVLLLQ